MAQYSYTDQKLTAAVNALATGTGTIQSRLHDAWLVSSTLRDNDFPQALRAELRRLRDAVTKPKSGNINTVRAQQEGAARIAREELDDERRRRRHPMTWSQVLLWTNWRIKTIPWDRVQRSSSSGRLY